MRRKIPAKLGIETLAFVLLVLLASNYQAILEADLRYILITTGIFGIVLAICLSIKYSLDDDFLYIKNGLFGTTKIQISEIRKIEKTWNLIASPAPSVFGRVEIYYGNNSIVISPKNFEAFKHELLKINPTITIKE